MKTISQKIVRLLKKKKLKISFAESCTGGKLSSAITSVNGSSKVFKLGLIGKGKAIACETISSVIKYD